MLAALLFGLLRQLRLPPLVRRLQLLLVAGVQPGDLLLVPLLRLLGVARVARAQPGDLVGVQLILLVHRFGVLVLELRQDRLVLLLELLHRRVVPLRHVRGLLLGAQPQALALVLRRLAQPLQRLGVLGLHRAALFLVLGDDERLVLVVRVLRLLQPLAVLRLLRLDRGLMLRLERRQLRRVRRDRVAVIACCAAATSVACFSFQFSISPS